MAYGFAKDKSKVDVCARDEVYNRVTGGAVQI